MDLEAGKEGLIFEIPNVFIDRFRVSFDKSLAHLPNAFKGAFQVWSDSSYYRAVSHTHTHFITPNHQLQRVQSSSCPSYLATNPNAVLPSGFATIAVVVTSALVPHPHVAINTPA